MKSIKKINADLMRWGYLCSDYSLHEWGPVEWDGDIANVTCKRCGKLTVAMARI